MKRQTRKAGKKLPMLWDESMDFEVAISPLQDPQIDPELEDKIIVLPLPSMAHKFPQTPPPPLAA
jgi:hypothetical protein